MQELIERHLVLYTHQKADTQECRRRALQEFARFYPDLDWSCLTRQQLVQYQQHLTWTPGPRGLRSANTLCQQLLMVRMFLRWLEQQGLLSQNCLEGWRFGKASARPPRLLSRDQVQAIVNIPDATPLGLRNRAILAVICELGLLSQACVDLNLDALDLVAYRLAGRKLGAELAEKLDRYLRQGRPALLTNPDEKALFLGRSGQRIVPMSICMALRARAGASNIGPRLLHRSWTAHHQAKAERRGLR